MANATPPGRIILGATLLAALAACAVPARQGPAVLRAPTAIGVSGLAGEGAYPADEWWKAYGDPGLDGLIAQALAGSPDVALAAARVRAADAAVEQAGGALLPDASVEATAGGIKQSYNMGLPKQFVPKGIRETGRLSLLLNFDLDLWGRNRALLAAARGEAAAARVDAAQARLLLTSGIALGWGQLAALEAARGEAAKSREALAGIERLTADRLHAGLDNKADLDLATARRTAAEQTLAALGEQIALERNRLAALAGGGPDLARTLPHPAPVLAHLTGVPATLGLDLVGRRPDLVSARMRVEASESRVEAARRAFYPDINLSAVAGLQSLGLSNLVSGDSSYAQFGPALNLPLFAGNRLSGGYETAGAGRDEAVARYDQTLIQAIREVADALESRRALAAQLAAARAGADAAGDAARLARLRYGQGLGNRIQVLAAEDSAATARRSLVELEARAFILDVTLVRTLGGGFAQPVADAEPARS